MKLSLTSITLLCLISVALSQSSILDWTVTNTQQIDAKCIDQIKNLKLSWTGDCEGSYAAMTASAIQDNICITFNKISNVSGVNEPLKKISDVKVSY
jgi:hypothetical protein